MLFGRGQPSRGEDCLFSFISFPDSHGLGLLHTRTAFHAALSCTLFFAQAFASFAAALAVQPLHTEALVACAAVYKTSGQLLKAVSTLETAVTAAHSDATVQQAYAVALNALGEWNAALLLHIATQQPLHTHVTHVVRALASNLLFCCCDSMYHVVKLPLQAPSLRLKAKEWKPKTSINKRYKYALHTLMGSMTWVCTTARISRYSS